MIVSLSSSFSNKQITSETRMDNDEDGKRTRTIASFPSTCIRAPANEAVLMISVITENNKSMKPMYRNVIAVSVTLLTPIYQ